MKTLATTRYSAIRPLSVKGQRVLDLQQQLARLVAGRSGDPSLALIFARPRIVERSDGVSWDTTADGTVQRIVDLAPAAQGAAYQKVERILAEINKIVETLRAAGSERSLLDAELLAAALEHAGDSDLFLVGDQPVMVNWGCEPAVKEAASVKPAHIARRPPEDPDLEQKIERVARREILELPPEQGRAPPGAAPAAVRLAPPGWWPWLLVWLVFLLVLIAEPFFAMGLAKGFATNGKQGLEAARAAQAGDLAAIDQLDRKITQQRATCTIGEIGPNTFAERSAARGMAPHKVTVSLIWNGEAGAVLYVRTPSGHLINFADREPPPGDVLHADFGSKKADTPKEGLQAIVAEKGLPPGHYEVLARVFDGDHPVAAPIPYGVQVAIEGRPPIIQYGYLRSVDKWLEKPIAEFDGGS